MRLKRAVTSPPRAEAPTFSQAVADPGVPGQQGVSAAEAQHQRVGQTQDGERVGDAVVAGPRLHTADPLKHRSEKCNEITLFCRGVFLRVQPSEETQSKEGEFGFVV